MWRRIWRQLVRSRWRGERHRPTGDGASRRGPQVGIALRIAATAIVVGSIGWGATGRADAAVSLCGIGLRDLSAIDHCYPPSAVALAERHMPVPVVSLRGVVWRVTGLRLQQVELRKQY